MRIRLRYCLSIGTVFLGIHGTHPVGAAGEDCTGKTDTIVTANKPCADLTAFDRLGYIAYGAAQITDQTKCTSPDICSAYNIKSTSTEQDVAIDGGLVCQFTVHTTADRVVCEGPDAGTDAAGGAGGTGGSGGAGGTGGSGGTGGCNSCGDPHLFAFSGLAYDFQATGEFILATNNRSFAVQERQKAQGGCAAVNVAVAAIVGENRIAVYAHENPSLRINGNPTEIQCASYPSKSSAKFAWTGGIKNADCWGELTLADGSRVVLNVVDRVATYTLRGPNDNEVAVVTLRKGGYLDISVSVRPEDAASTTGLLGSPDSDTTNTLRTRDGRLMPQPITFNQLYRDFGESWRVGQGESLFDYGPGEDTSTFTDRGFPSAPCRPLSDDEHLAAEDICKSAGITNRDLLLACIFDVGATGDPVFADSYVGMQGPKATLMILDDATAPNADEPNSIAFARVGGCACEASGHKPSSFGSVLLVVLAPLLYRGRIRFWPSNTRSTHKMARRSILRSD